MLNYTYFILVVCQAFFIFIISNVFLSFPMGYTCVTSSTSIKCSDCSFPYIGNKQGVVLQSISLIAPGLYQYLPVLLLHHEPLGTGCPGNGRMATGSEPGGCLLLGLLPFYIAFPHQMVCKPLESSYTSPHSGLYIQQKTNLGNYTADHFFTGLRGGKVWKNKRHSRPPLPQLSLFFLANNRFFFLQQEDLGKATTKYSCDGHNDCGAGCLCLWSVAYCDNSQPVLLSAVLLARWTNCGLFLG